MPPKRPATNSASSSRVKRAKQPTRPVTITNIRTNASRRLDDVKILKVPNPRGGRGEGAFTIVATPRAKIGDSEVIDGILYVVRSEQQLRELVKEGLYTSAAHTCTSRITDMSLMFSRARTFNQPIGHWDTSKVTNMKGMFTHTHFNRPIDGWDTSRVANMTEMFYFSTHFNQSIGGWDTSRVTTMAGMFSGAWAFNRNIGGWNTIRVDDMQYMFYGAQRFNQAIGGWDTSRVMNMYRMFNEARRFNQPIGGWDTSRVQNMASMFEGARRFNQDISGWDVRSVRFMRDMFRGARVFNRNLSTWATRLSRDVRMDDDTRRRIYGEPVDPLTQAFTSRRYRLHPSANAIDQVMMNRVPLNDARVIAGDVDKNAHIRHIFHKDTLNAMARHGRGTLRHPSTRAVFLPGHIVPLRSVLHANDAAIYNRVGVNERTVEDVRMNANKAKNKKKNGR